MPAIAHLLPLFVAAGILLAGNGIQGTLISLRANLEGFDPVVIGLLGTAYFAGFALACLLTPRLIRNVGHIRVFAALAALASAGTMALVLVIDPLVENRIWAGTDIGVFVSEDGADTWTYASNGMPRVAIFDMKARDNGRIIACTHGRSVFAADLNEAPLFTDGFESGNTSIWSRSDP